jgi:predicted nucleic acid-binding protein
MDTFALIGWINARDAHHQRVKSYLENFSGDIVTTEWILLEFADALSHAKTKPFAIEAIKRIYESPMFRVVGFESPLRLAGRALYESRVDKDWSLTDCVSFAVMAQHGLTDALTADHHFEQAGFRALFK